MSSGFVWFHPRNRTCSERNARIFALHEMLHGFVDFVAGATFVVGSILFLDPATAQTGTWMFIVGSVCFALKPTIRFARELRYWRDGDMTAFHGPAGR